MKNESRIKIFEGFKRNQKSKKKVSSIRSLNEIRVKRPGNSKEPLFRDLHTEKLTKRLIMRRRKKILYFWKKVSK